MNVQRILWHSQVWMVSNLKLIDIYLKHSFCTASFLSNLFFFVFLLVFLMILLRPLGTLWSLIVLWAFPWVSGLIFYNNNDDKSKVQNAKTWIRERDYFCLQMLFSYNSLRFRNLWIIATNFRSARTRAKKLEMCQLMHMVFLDS